MIDYKDFHVVFKQVQLLNLLKYNCFVLILWIFVCDFGKYFLQFPNFLSFYAEYNNHLLFSQMTVCGYNIFQKNLKIGVLMLKQQINALVCLLISTDHLQCTYICTGIPTQS